MKLSYRIRLIIHLENGNTQAFEPATGLFDHELGRRLRTGEIFGEAVIS